MFEDHENCESSRYDLYWCRVHKDDFLEDEPRCEAYREAVGLPNRADLIREGEWD